MFPREVVLVSAQRTPIGKFLGGFKDVSAVKLGAHAISAALRRSFVKPNEVDHVYFGHVLSAGCGQNPTRQASLQAKLPHSVDVTSVNKVCASGLKAVHFAAQEISLGHSKICVAGGMESMSQVPYLLRNRSRGLRYGDRMLEDSLLHDGLLDAYDGIHMGVCAEKLVRDFKLSRQSQDEYALQSYDRAATAWKRSLFRAEVCEVDGTTEDEEYKFMKLDKMGSLKPAFISEADGGTITPANASKLNDGAAALVLMSLEEANVRGLLPLARILSFADSARAPIDFPLAAGDALKKAVQRAKLSMDDIEVFEINEAFSAVALANLEYLQLDSSRVNLNGGAVALGHPLGCSGARILVTLLHVLQQNELRLGACGICNGGGGGSAIVVERLS